MYLKTHRRSSGADRFDPQGAQARLEAVEYARQLLQDATDALSAADVRNVRVAKAMAACRKELTDYSHVTEFSIRKREKRARKTSDVIPDEEREDADDQSAGP